MKHIEEISNETELYKIKESPLSERDYGYYMGLLAGTGAIKVQYGFNPINIYLILGGASKLMTGVIGQFLVDRRNP